MIYTVAMSFLTKDNATHRSENLEVTRVHINLDLTDITASTYRAEAFFYLSSTLPDVTIDVAAHTINAVTIDGDDTTFTENGEHITITNVPTDEPCVIGVDALMRYSTTGQGLHRFIDHDDNTTYIYSHCEPADAHRAWPCFDQSDIKPVWEFSVKAPTAWTVTSNRKEFDVVIDENDWTWEFGTTEPLSAYLTAIAAGNWYVIDDIEPWQGKVNGQDLDVPLRILCRQSLKDFIDTDHIVETTKAGLDFYHERYRYAYPWGKYDQIFCPEYNIGAMENPGLVTFNENFISRDKPTSFARQRLAGTLLHEMCHMWFGDLVTMRWWDDLWLKESFADYESYCALAAATAFSDSWANIAIGRKTWGYEADAYSTTHPIVANAPTVEQAQQNFDGISYAKGAAVLQQLHAWLGDNAYIAGLRRYFSRFAFSSTDRTQFLQTLAEGTGKDVDEWARTWLAASGITHLSTTRNATHVTISQHNADSQVVRPHVFCIDEYDNASTPHRIKRHHVDLDGTSTTIELEKADSILALNADDSTFAIWDLTKDEARQLVALLHMSEKSLLRAVMWQTLYQGVRYHHIDPHAFIKATTLQFDRGVPTVLLHLLRHTRDVMNFCSIDRRREYAAQLFADISNRICQSTDNEKKYAYGQSVFQLAALASNADNAEGIQHVMSQFSDVDVLWNGVMALVSLGVYSMDDVSRFQKLNDDTFEGRRHRLSTRYAGADGWQRAFSDIERDINATDHMATDHVRAIVRGAHWAATKDVDVSAYIDLVQAAWDAYPQHMATIVVNGLFAHGYYNADDLHKLGAFIDTADTISAQLKRLLIENYEAEKRYVDARDNN